VEKDDVDAERYWSGLERQKPNCKVVLETTSCYKSKQRIVRLL